MVSAIIRNFSGIKKAASPLQESAASSINEILQKPD
jgi:hypothetical protein